MKQPVDGDGFAALRSIRNKVGTCNPHQNEE